MASQRAWPAFFVIGAATLIGPLDTSVNIAFPNITAGFAITIASIQWVVICYVLTFASLMLAFGRLGDIIGHIHVFRAGLALSAVAFLCCGFARQFEWLLLFRVMQGAGAAMVISCGPALITRVFAEAERAKALGGYTIIFGLGSAIGPAMGGWMVEIWDWPSVFWFRVPLSLAALLLTFVVVMPSTPRAPGRFDLLGAVMLAGGIALLLMAMNRLSQGLSGAALGLLMVGLGLLFSFVFQQRRLETPLLQLSLFRDPDFSLLNVATVVVNAAGFSVWLLVPYYLVNATSFDLVTAGFVLATGPLGMMVAGHYGGHLMRPLGANRIAGLGALAVAGAVALIGCWPEAAHPVFMVAALLLHGLGLGLFQVASLEFVIATLPPVDRGVAGSLVMVNRTFGLVAGASLLTLLFVFLQRSQSGDVAPFLSAFQQTFLITGFILLLFVLVTQLFRGFWLRRPAEH